MEAEVTVLRPHHGMCFQFFEGKGYNGEFTGHMGRVIKMLSENPSAKIILRTSVDEVCKCCPNNAGGICISRDKVQRYDREVLKYCGLADGAGISYEDFLMLVKERIIDTGKRSDICGDCTWDHICGNHRSS